MLRRILIGLAIAGVIAAGGVLQLLWVAGHFKTLEPHFAGSCVEVDGIAGAEDITIHPKTGVAYLSAFDRRALGEGRPARGGIYAYDLDAASPRLVDLLSRADGSFHPHGISLSVGADGRETLLAVNHAEGRHTIEVYDLVDGRLSHRETVSDPMLVSPNDLVAMGPDRFYVTNDHGHVDGLMRSLEEYLRLPLSNVVYYDGAHFSEAASGIGLANGINVSADGRTVYVNSLSTREVRVYDRDPQTGVLAERESIFIDSGGDNIEIDARGDLWIGAHPKILDVVAHMSDPSRLAPAQVLRVSLGPAGDHRIEEIYLNLGEQLCAATVAAVRGKRMLVGAVLDARFLDCRLD